MVRKVMKKIIKHHIKKATATLKDLLQFAYQAGEEGDEKKRLMLNHPWASEYLSQTPAYRGLLSI